MDFDRRQVLIGSAGAAIARLFPAGHDTRGPGFHSVTECHPLTRSLLDRARKIGQCREAPDGAAVERAIGQFAGSSDYARRPVIKWMDTPSDAFDHLSRFGLDALLEMATDGFWRRCRPPVPQDARALDRAFEVRMLANDLLGVDEHDRLLMAPKLRAKSEAISASSSDAEVFQVRATSSQIGWLETSLADVAAGAVSNVELLLSTGASEGSVAIDHQLSAFESHERGLLATWETPAELVCVPRYI
jgi:hypothetical protein